MTKPLAGKRCLVLDDEFLIALDIQQVLEQAGAGEVVCAGNVAEALTAMRARTLRPCRARPAARRTAVPACRRPRRWPPPARRSCSSPACAPTPRRRAAIRTRRWSRSPTTRRRCSRPWSAPPAEVLRPPPADSAMASLADSSAARRCRPWRPEAAEIAAAWRPALRIVGSTMRCRSTLHGHDADASSAAAGQRLAACCVRSIVSLSTISGSFYDVTGTTVETLAIGWSKSEVEQWLTRHGNPDRGHARSSEAKRRYTRTCSGRPQRSRSSLYHGPRRSTDSPC